MEKSTCRGARRRDLRARKPASGVPRSDCVWPRAPLPSRDISSSSLNTSRPRATPQRAPDAAPPGVGRSAMLRGRGQPLWLQRARILAVGDGARRAERRYENALRREATSACMRLVNTPTAPTTCSVWSESPDVRARDVRGRRAARPPVSSTCSKIALTGCSVASGPSAASLGLPDERRKASFEAFVVKNAEKKLFYRIRLS